MSTPAQQTPIQPKVNKKLAMRFGLGLLAIAALLFAYRYIQQNRQPGLSRSATTGYVAALLEHEDGSQAVVFNADGTLQESPGYSSGANDSGLVWSPDGNGLYFTSDREKNEPHVFRWDLGRSSVDRRTLDRRAKGEISFTVPGSSTPSSTALMVWGGTVVEYDPREATGAQVLPPPNKGAVGEEGGRAGQFDLAYQQIGTSFRTARWGPDKAWIAAVMKREDGEVLIVQDLQQATGPRVVAVAQKIDFDIFPSGQLAIAIQDFQFIPGEVPEEFKKDGKVIRPYHHALVVINLDGNAPIVLGTSPDDQLSFRQPRVSPDGTRVLVAAGPWKEPGYVDTRGLFVVPLTQGAAAQTMIKQGAAEDASWAPSGDQITFIAKDATGNRSVFTVRADGTGERNLTAGKGNFRTPLFSPQAR
jgi:dipeptidyl aminopeptidase/acylaminoacyl peptidase